MPPSSALRSLSQPQLGVCQWFHYEDEPSLEQAVASLRDLGATHLRTGISWADYHRPGGAAWYRRQMEALDEFELLVSIWHTPPSIAEGGTCASPPRRLDDYADFVEQMIQEYGDHFEHLELWNEPNNRYKWDFEGYDPDWSRFAAMIRPAARRAREAGKTTVLGGISPIDPEWVALVDGYGALEDVEVIGIHGFPEMAWDDAPSWDWYGHWPGWGHHVQAIEKRSAGRPVWITETGLATWDLRAARPARHGLQVERLEKAARAPVPRCYWYSLIDLDPQRDAIEGFHVDENEYHMGLVRFDATAKPAYETFARLLSPADEAHVRAARL